MYLLVRGERCSWAEHASLSDAEVDQFLHMCANVWDSGQLRSLGFHYANSRAKSKEQHHERADAVA